VPAPTSTQGPSFPAPLDALLSTGRAIYSLAIFAIGVETMVIARTVAHPLGAQYNGISVIPWLPAIPGLGYLFGVIWIACAIGMLIPRTLRTSALLLGVLFSVCTLVLIIPKYLRLPGDMGLRTVVFEPLSIACLAWLMIGPNAIPSFLERGSRYLSAIAMVIFGVDHFLGLGFIASLLPRWIPWHVFWVAFFGVAFIAAGISFAARILLPWAAAGLGLMFAIWVLTLHLPRVLGLYGIPGAPKNPDEYSSLFIAVALWGGPWALARVYSRRTTANPQ
jgi:uncharacterized membrane protein